MKRVGRTQSRTGFTLVELLTVIVIISLLAAITVVGVNAVKDRNNRQATESIISKLVLVMDQYKESCGSLPLVEYDGVNHLNYVNYAWLQNLKLDMAFGAKANKEKGRTQVVNVTVSGLPYDVICDIWRHPIKVANPGVKNVPGLDVWSMGADGKDSSAAEQEDDVCNWKMR